MSTPDPTTASASSTDDMRKPYEGQLNKFTNVMKGWQYRWFVLDPESGKLEYFLLDERKAGSTKSRGSQHLAGAVVMPSDEDSQTFNVNFASGESYKLRAVNVRERQMWVDRIRNVAHLHDQAIAQNNPPLSALSHSNRPATPPGSRSHIANGEPSYQLQHLSLSVLDAFGSVHDIIHQAELKNSELCRAIEELPNNALLSSPNASGDNKTSGPGCLDEELLILKATSHASLLSVEQALTVLQDYRELNQGSLMTTSQHISKSVFGLPSSPKKSFSGGTPAINPSQSSSFFGSSSSPSKAKNSFKALTGGGSSKSSSSSAAALSSSTLSLPAELKTAPAASSSSSQSVSASVASASAASNSAAATQDS